jgi:hypothetical protein
MFGRAILRNRNIKNQPTALAVLGTRKCHLQWPGAGYRCEFLAMSARTGKQLIYAKYRPRQFRAPCSNNRQARGFLLV